MVNCLIFIGEMRSRNSFERGEAFRDARLVVIASEGKDTERIYFNALAREYANPRVHGPWTRILMIAGRKHLVRECIGWQKV